MLLRGCKNVVLGLTFVLLWAGVSPCFAQGDNLPLDAKAKGLAHYIMAVSHDLNGEATLAISEYEQSVSYNPKEKAPRLRLGAYYVRLGLLDDAVTQLQKVIALNPSEVQAQYLLALIYSSQNKFDLAASSYESILKFASQNNPENIEIYQYLAQLYYSQHKYGQAIEQFKKIIEIRPDDVASHYTLGTVYLDTKERPKAMELFRKVLTLEPSHDGALNSLAYMYAEDGVHLDEAIKMVRQAIEIDSSNGAYYDTLGWALFKKGMHAEALMALQKAEYYILDPVIYEHMGDVYVTVKEFALARKYFRKSLDIDPHQPAVLQKIQQLEETQALIE